MNDTTLSLQESEKDDALSAMTVGDVFRESAVHHLDPIKVLGGFSSFPGTGAEEKR